MKWAERTPPSQPGWWQTDQRKAFLTFMKVFPSLDVSPASLWFFAVAAFGSIPDRGGAGSPLDAHGAPRWGGSLTTHALPLQPALPSPSAHKPTVTDFRPSVGELRMDLRWSQPG